MFCASAEIHNCERCLVASSTPVSVSWVPSSFQVQDLLTVKKIAHFLTDPRPLLNSCEPLMCLLGLEFSCSQGLDEGAILWALSPCPFPGRQSPMAPHSWDAAEVMSFPALKSPATATSTGSVLHPKSSVMSSWKACTVREQADTDSHRQEHLQMTECSPPQVTSHHFSPHCSGWYVGYPGQKKSCLSNNTPSLLKTRSSCSTNYT